VNNYGIFINIKILTQEGWKNSSKEIKELIKKIQKELIKNEARIDLRINKIYSPLQVEKYKEIKIKEEFQKDNIETRDDFSISLKTKTFSNENQVGDKIIFPKNYQNQFNTIKKPYLFELKSNFSRYFFSINSRCFGGSGFNNLEFTSEDGFVTIPKWMLKNLYLKENDIVNIRLVHLSLGSFCNYLY
jgi:hypothetical protein